MIASSGVRRFDQPIECFGYKHLRRSHGSPFWIYFQPTRANLSELAELHDAYPFLTVTMHGPPTTVMTPTGQSVPLPPNITSGRDSLVFLSMHCHPDRRCSSTTKCFHNVREQSMLTSAIERQCALAFGPDWETRR